MLTFLKSKWATLILLAAVVWFGGGALSTYRQSQEVREEGKDLKEKISVLELTNAALQEEVNLNNDPEYLERQAKIQLNYRPADEQVAFIYRAPTPGPASSSFDASPSDMAKYWGWLKGLFE